ncbi:hypothetical protein OSTOST_14473 [Ostertagia ostertagi]
MEKVAHRLLDFNGKNYQRRGYSVNHYQGPINDPEIRLWLNQTTDYWLRDFSSMQRIMYPYSPYVACAHKIWNNHGQRFAKVVCVFEDKRRPWEPFMPPPTGSPCQHNENCVKFGWNYECAASLGLCFAPSHSTGAIA